MTNTNRNWGVPKRRPTTPLADRPKFLPLAMLAIVCVLILSATLSGCASRTPTPPAAVATASVDGHAARPLLCSETSAITYHLGKITPEGAPDLTVEDIRAALVRPDAVDYVRRLTGDTSDTIARIKVHNAIMDRLCNGVSR